MIVLTWITQAISRGRNQRFVVLVKYLHQLFLEHTLQFPQGTFLRMVSNDKRALIVISRKELK